MHKSIKDLAQDIQLIHERFFYRPSAWLAGTLFGATAGLGVDLLGGWEFYRYPYLTAVIPGLMTVDAIRSALRMGPNAQNQFRFSGLETLSHPRYGEIRFFDHQAEKLPRPMRELYRGGSHRACAAVYAAAAIPYVGAAWGIWGIAEGVSWWKN